MAFSILPITPAFAGPTANCQLRTELSFYRNRQAPADMSGHFSGHLFQVEFRFPAPILGRYTVVNRFRPAVCNGLAEIRLIFNSETWHQLLDLAGNLGRCKTDPGQVIGRAY